MNKKVVCHDLNDIPMAATPLGGNARMLAANPHLRLVNLHIAAGEQVLEHTVPVEVVFLVLEGSGSVQIEDQVYGISTGQMLICPADCKRSIKTSEDDCVSLLVIRTPNL